MSNAFVQGVTDATSSDLINEMPLDLVAFGGYNAFQKRYIEAGKYIYNDNGSFVKDGDPFIIINVETNSALMTPGTKLNGKQSHLFNAHQIIYTEATSIDKATQFYYNIEDGLVCFSHRETLPIFKSGPNQTKVKERKIFIIGRKGNPLYSYSHLNRAKGGLQDFRGFKVIDVETTQSVTRLKYCTPYKFSQANNLSIGGNLAYINVQNFKDFGTSFVNPNNAKENGANNTFILFPYINDFERMCMSFQLNSMIKLKKTNILWKGSEFSDLIDECGEKMITFCNSGPKIFKDITYYPVLSSYCFDFYKEKLRYTTSPIREQYDAIIENKCAELYEKGVQSPLCKCQDAVNNYNEVRDGIELQMNPICYSNQCQKLKGQLYLTRAQETSPCRTTVCIYEDIDKNIDLKVIQICEGGVNIIKKKKPNQGSERDNDDKDIVDDSDKDIGDDSDKDIGDDNDDEEDDSGDKDDDPKDKKPKNNTLFYILVGGGFVAVIFIIFFLLRRKNK